MLLSRLKREIMKWIISAACLICGVVAGYYIPHKKVVEEKTVLRTEVVQSPAEIVYKDKVREIKIKCPATVAKTEVVREVQKNKSYYPLFKVNTMINPFDVKDVRVGIGYFIKERISIDVQSNLKFDTFYIGASLYF
jgi:hypothetical protein